MTRHKRRGVHSSTDSAEEGLPMRNSITRSVVGVLVVLALAAVPAGAPIAQGKGTIKIASQSPLSGGQAALGEGIKLGAQLAVEKFKGPLEKMGFKVEFVPYDDQAKPDVGVSNSKNIIADKDILAIIGHLNSGVAIPSSEVYKEVSLAMISPATTNPVVTDRGYPNVNRVGGRDDVQGVVGSEFAHGTMKAKAGHIIHDKTPYGQGVAEALPKAKRFADEFKKKFGKNPEPYAAEAYDAATIAIKAIEAAAKGGKAPSREDVAVAVRKAKLGGITGDIEFDAKGDRKKALYFVLQVASDDPGKWGDNKIVKQLTIAAPAAPKK